MTNLVPETEMREVTELNAKINLLLAMSSLADAEITRKENELARVVAEVEAIQSSTSWRITAPLRWLRKKIGNGDSRKVSREESRRK